MAASCNPERGPPDAVLDGAPLPSGPLVVKMELSDAETKGPIYAPLWRSRGVNVAPVI